MATIDVLDQTKKKVGTLELRDDVFGVEVNSSLVHQVLKAQLAARRQGTAKTKTRSEVRGGGKKPYKQKGTGNARQGSIRSPLWVGGGQSFGPVPRSYEQKTPKEMVRGALRSVLADRFKESRILVLDQFQLKDHKTKAFSEVVKKYLCVENVLVVDEENRSLELASRNIPKVRFVRSTGITVYDLVKHDWLVVTKAAIESIQERLKPAKKGGAAHA